MSVCFVIVVGQCWTKVKYAEDAQKREDCGGPGGCYLRPVFNDSEQTRQL